MDVGKISGWIALIVMAVSFCTAVRNPRLSSIYGGYPRQIRIHHWLGLAAVLMMIVHLGILLADFWSAIELLFALSDTPIALGWIAILSTLAIVMGAFKFKTTPYRRWRYTHVLLSFAFVAAVLHSYLILEPRTYLQWASISGVVLIGGVGLAWAIALPLMPFFGLRYLITEQTVLRSDLLLQRLAPKDRSNVLRITAGQFLFLRFENARFTRAWHPFTVVGFSDSGDIELLVKMRGRDTNLLPEAKLPIPISINGPFGNAFWLSKEPQVWIAYGVGVAIFLAATRSMSDDVVSPVHFVYCDKTSDHIVLKEDFDALSVRCKNFSWETFFGEGPEVVGRIEQEIDAWVKKYRLFRVCGHPGFQAAVRDLLVASGISKDHIILEGVF